MEQAPILDCRPVMPSGGRWAGCVRGVMLAVAVGAMLLAGILTFNPIWPMQEWLGGGAIGTPASPVTEGVNGESAQWQYLPRAIGYFGVFLLSQWVFLMPKGSWRLGMVGDAPPSRRSAVAAGLIGMVLSIGLIAALMELPDWWLAMTTERGLNNSQRFGAVWAVMGILWLVWGMVFWGYMKGVDRYTGLGKVLRWLVAGTVLELVIAAPAHAWIISSRGDECYCQRGTWTGVAFGVTAALWLFGPGAALLFIREKRRREELI